MNNKQATEKEECSISYMSALTKMPVYVHESITNNLQSQISILQQENLLLKEKNLQLKTKNIELLEERFKYSIKNQPGYSEKQENKKEG